MVDLSDGQVSVWLEKEQVVMLGNAVDELLERLAEEAGIEPAGTAPDSFRGDLEVKAASISIGYDEARRGFTFQASDLYETPFELDTVSLLTDRSQLVQIAEEIADIVAASRPRCLLCGAPLTAGGHFCPPSNGHTEVSVTE